MAAQRRNKVKTVSHFRLADEAAKELLAISMRHAVSAGEEEGKKRIERAASRRGYELNADDFLSHVSPLEGVLALGGDDHFWWRFFEFGTVHIQAMPALRPAHRKARKVLLEDLGLSFEKWIRARAYARPL